MANDRQCFTKRSAVVLPDKTKVLANLTNGGAGRSLVEALLDGRVDDARDMLSRDPRLLNTVVTHDPRMDRFPDGQYGDLLTIAVSRCDQKAIAMLIDLGMSPNGSNPGAALSLALLADTPDMAEQLFRAGASADPNPVANANDPMSTAMTFSHKGAVMALLRHSANPRLADEFGNDRVRDAVSSEQTEIAEILVDHGGSLWTIADDGSMAVHDLLTAPVVFKTPEMDAARARLIEIAKASGLPWPPPDRTIVKKMVLSGQWPTAAMAKAGMAVSPQVLKRMRTQ